MIRKVAIIGSHGLYANYGGWDQLVKNLAEKKTPNLEYLIFNSKETPKRPEYPADVTVRHLCFKASGFQGLFYDFWSILVSYFRYDTLLLLGVQGIPLIPFLRVFKNTKVVSNVGGIEWERPKFGFFSRMYLKFCFNLSFLYSASVILDNQHYKIYLPKQVKSDVLVIPYGGEIDNSLVVNEDLIAKYPFIQGDYCLSTSRALSDNMIEELCESFVGSRYTLVMISNFSSSAYGERVYKKYCNCPNMILINGLYKKDELDLVRRKCKVYIHTHTLCGTAPSLVEMIIARCPIMAIDVPQNRFTLHNEGFFFSEFSQIQEQLNSDDGLSRFVPAPEIVNAYDWSMIVRDYERSF